MPRVTALRSAQNDNMNGWHDAQNKNLDSLHNVSRRRVVAGVAGVRG